MDKNAAIKIYNKANNRIKTVLLPEFANTEDRPDENTTRISNLIVSQLQFYESINQTRQKLHIKPANLESTGVESLIKIRKSIPDEQFDDISREMKKHFKLSLGFEWNLSIVASVFFNVFPIPIIQSIALFAPKPYDITEYDDKGNIKYRFKTTHIPFEQHKLSQETEIYPSIIIRDKVTIDAIYQYLISHKKQLDEAMNHIGELKFSKIDEKTVYWGYVVSLFREEGIAGWVDQERIIACDGSPFVMDCGPDGITPNFNDLANYYRSYKDASSRLYLIKSD